MEEKVLEILERNFNESIEFDRNKATEELLILFGKYQAEQLTLTDVSQQRELLIGALEEYNNVKYEWTKLTYEDYVNKYHPNL